MDNSKQIFSLVDILASEYGWSLEYCMKLPGDVISNLIHAISSRKLLEAKKWTKLIGAACAVGFSGKLEQLDKLFSTETQKDDIVDKVAWKGQVKSLWMKMQTKNKKNLTEEEYKKLTEEFEVKWASGESIKF